MKILPQTESYTAHKSGEMVSVVRLHMESRVVGIFFFQAEDGIRDHCVTGVQTCALPILTGGRIKSSFGMEIETERAADANFDTLLIGSPPDVSPPSPELISFLQGALANTRRIAAICIGAFILGEAGLLDGRRATTHWLFAKELQRRFPRASVEVDRIFIADS